MIIGVSNKPKDTQGLLRKLKENSLKSIETVKDRLTDFNLYDEETSILFHIWTF